MNNEEIRFKGIVVRCRYNSDNFKIYVVDVNRLQYILVFSKIMRCLTNGYCWRKN